MLLAFLFLKTALVSSIYLNATLDCLNNLEVIKICMCIIYVYYIYYLYIIYICIYLNKFCEIDPITMLFYSLLLSLPYCYCELILICFHCFCNIIIMVTIICFPRKEQFPSLHFYYLSVYIYTFSYAVYGYRYIA